MQEEGELLAVAEVARDDAVRCMARGCGHVVHKRIHIVTYAGRCIVMGSDCFRAAFRNFVGRNRVSRLAASCCSRPSNASS